MKYKKELILIADDDEDILNLVKEILEKHGYATVLAKNSEEAISKVKKLKPDLVILDLRFPVLGGLEVCKIIRSNPEISSIPILMLTVQNSPVDRIIGLESGADDYLGKPFSPDELIARIKAILRRVKRNYHSGGVIESGKLKIDLDRRVVHVGNKIKRLRPKEFDLLLLFINNKNKVLSREKIMREIWDMEYFPGMTRTVDIHVRSIRKSLGLKNLKTVFSVGYVLEDE